MLILAINCGSSSVKYKVLDVNNGKTLLSKKVEQIGAIVTYKQAIEELIKEVKPFAISAVGHRVVHGGSRYSDAVLIDDSVRTEISTCIADAPLHNPYNLEGIEIAQKAYPDLPHVAVFDTAFHMRMPKRAQTYALDYEVAEKYKLRRYGFHGTSHSYVAELAAKFLQRPLRELRIVSLHLGNGASACAIENGISVETSMGMTPLEGLVMGTRAGDVDAGMLLNLMRTGDYDVESLDQLLNKKSGLLGLSGLTNDLREIEQAAADGDKRAQLAINVFAHRARKYVGAYAAVMGGLDAVIFTAGIGENSKTMRQRIMQRLDFLGLQFDEDKNNDCQLNDENKVVTINREHSGVVALVVKTNEALMIAQQTQQLVMGLSKQIKRLNPVPIAVSARHLHLNEETFNTLFGEDATPTHYKDISQPGQFACEEKVNLIGPRNTIKGVRLLGPLRTQNQIEISRSDEFKLGVDAPVRDSGNTAGSAPIILEGPNGKIHLNEGLICARRHIHMHPDDARHYGVENGEVIEIAINSEGRDLTFGDVLIRVSPKYKLEMHIDTDEANAAEITNNVKGKVVYTNIDLKKASGRIKT